MSAKTPGITVDSLHDFRCAAFTEDKIKRLLEMLARTGFKRVYWYDYPPHTSLFRECGIFTGALPSLANVPGHMPIAVKAAHELGLEIFATYKPYEQGMGISHVPGSDLDRKYGRIERIGGRAVWVTDWLAEHQDLRVERRMDDIPEDVHDRVIDRIEIDKNDDAPSGLCKEDIRIYVSRDNGSYQPFAGEWRLTEETVDTLLLDYFGHQINTETHPVRRLVLSGLGIGPERKFVAVTAEDKADRFRFIPMTMCRVYDDEGKRIPVTFASDLADRPLDATDKRFQRNFLETGFEFDDYGRASGASGVYFDTGCLKLKLGIARGVNEYLMGSLCEGYPEVREYWMGHVRRILALSPDGIEIRIAAHGNDTQDPLAYGFNEPILERYREKEGADGVADDPVKIMRIRGEFFTRFLTEASREIRAAGKTVQAQVIGPYATGRIRAIANRSFGGMWPDWEEWVRDLVDAVTFRDFLARNYNPNFDKIIKPFARSFGREVWVPAYFSMSGCNVHDAYLRAVEADDDVTGVMFYETAPNYEERDGRFEWKPEWADIISRFMERNR